jgi:putative zinc finger/helix-turn-helix YgiT family protein
MSTNAIQCPLCDEQARVVSVRHEVTVGRRRVLVDDEYMQCDKCDEAFYTPDQSEQLRARASAAAEREANLLSGSEIANVRLSLQLTQTEFEQLLGVGAKTSARWESGRVRPNVATDRLIRLLAANPQNVQILAGINGVTLRKAVPSVAAVVFPEWSHAVELRFAFPPGALKGGVRGSLTGTLEPSEELDQNEQAEFLRAAIDEPKVIVQGPEFDLLLIGSGALVPLAGLRRIGGQP